MKKIIVGTFLCFLFIMGTIFSTSFAAVSSEAVLKCGNYVYEPNKTHPITPNQQLKVESSNSNKPFTSIVYMIDNAATQVNSSTCTFYFPWDADYTTHTIRIKGSYDNFSSWSEEQVYYFHKLNVTVKHNNKVLDENYDQYPNLTTPLVEVKPGDKIEIIGDPSDLITHVAYVYFETDDKGKETYGEDIKYLSGTSYSYVVPESAVGKILLLVCSAHNRTEGAVSARSPSRNYRFKVLAKNESEPEEKVSVQLTKQDDGVLAKAIVTNGTFKQFTYSWDGGSNSTSTKNPTTIAYPTGEGIHTLKINATTQSGKKSSEMSVDYEVKPEETVTIKLTNQDDGVLAKATISNGTFKQITYAWDNGTSSTSTKNPTTIAYPTAVGSHTLKVTATTQSGKKSSAQSVTYEVEAPVEEPVETVSVKLTKQDDGVLAKATVTNGTFKQITYAWDNAASSTSTKNPTTIAYPTTVGNHTLKVTATTQSGKKSSQSVSYDVTDPGTVEPEKEEKITVSLTAKDSSVEARATVENATFKQFSYAWDNGTQKTSTSNPLSISYPTEVGEHTLKVFATTQNNTKSGTESLDYEVKKEDEQETESDPEPVDPDPITTTGKITAKISGKSVSEKESSPTSAKYGNEIIITLEPESNFSNVRYNWDNENLQVLSSENVIKVPNFNDNLVHKLSLKGVLTNSDEVLKEYYLYVPSDYVLELEIDPWMEENDDSEGLLISLRNKSDLIKANKNYYMLNEEINYLIDYKNSDKNTSDEIKVELKLPLAFEVIDTAGGIVDKSKKTITWTYSEGLKQNESDTRRVIVKYTSLTKRSSASEMVYPQATIYKKGKAQDISSVINCIYLDDDTLFEDKHTPYMLGDQGKATFRPNDNITRAEGALVLMRIFGVKFDNVNTLTDKFSDLDQTYLEAQRAITKATEIGIINGYPDGTYRPKSSMTRAEFMKIIAAYIESNAEVKGLEVKDKNAVLIYKYEGEKAIWAVPYVTLLVRLNMTSASYNEKDLRLDEAITRAEVAQLCNFYLFRAPAKVSINTTTNFEDVTNSHKLFGDIIEATRPEHQYMVTDDGKEKIK